MVTGFLLISINIGKFSITKYYSIKKLTHTGISKNYTKKSYNDLINLNIFLLNEKTTFYKNLWLSNERV